MKELVDFITELEKYQISKVNLIALVSDTSSEVIFYCDYKGNRVQSNALSEEYDFDTNVIDGFYEKVTAIIRESGQFNKEKMNIVRIEDKDVMFEYDEKVCRTYKIIKEWTKRVL